MQSDNPEYRSAGQKKLNACQWKVRKECMGVYAKFLDWPPVVRTANGTALCH